MPLTPVWGLRSPELSNQPHGPQQIQNLADDTETGLTKAKAWCIGYAEQVAPSAAHASATYLDVLSVTVPVVAGRRYRIEVGQCLRSGGSSTGESVIRDGSNNVLRSSGHVRVEVLGYNIPADVKAYYVASSTGNVTFKNSIIHTNGNSIWAQPTPRSFIAVEDRGVA